MIQVEYMFNILLSSVFLILLFSFIMMIRVSYFQHKLYKYLKLNYFEKWKELTSIGKLGPGFQNGRKALIFIFNNEDLGDSKIILMKVKIRISLMLCLTGFVGAFIWFCILVSFFRS